MSDRSWSIFAGVWLLVACGAASAPVMAQTAEVKEKPPMYTYVSNWAIPRGQWDEMEKPHAGIDKVMQTAISGGFLVGYGQDVTLVHGADGSTHDTWWSAMSMADILNTLDEIHKAGGASSAVLKSATKHWDNVYVSRFYNWHSGSWHGAYTHESSYKLKADAPDDAVETLSKTFIVPLLEKLLTDGSIIEYEIDEQAIHTEAPGTFAIVYIAANGAGVDKVNAALRQALKANPLAGPAFGSDVDFTAHRDELSHTTATYK